MCDELKTHTDGRRGLCKGHAYEVKQAGGEVALELEPEPESTGKGKGKAVAKAAAKTCEWPDWPTLEPNDSEQPTEE